MVKNNGNICILAVGLEFLEYQDQYSSQVGVTLMSNSNVYISAMGLEC